MMSKNNNGMGCMTVFSMTLIISIVLMVLKSAGLISISWLMVWLPTGISLGLGIVIVILIFVLNVIQEIMKEL